MDSTAILDATLERFQQARDASTLISTFDDAVRQHGAFGFVSNFCAGGRREGVMLYTSTPEVFAPLDMTGPWWERDPTLDRIMGGEIRPYAFDAELMAADPYALERYGILRDCGFGAGEVYPTSGGGDIGGVLVFADGPEGTREIGARRSVLHCLAVMMQGFMNGLELGPDEAGVIRNGVASSCPDGLPGFSLAPREADCLAWCARGKTAEETALILGLSVHTVRHYLRSACARLGAHTQAQAVAVALRAGLLSL